MVLHPRISPYHSMKDEKSDSLPAPLLEIFSSGKVFLESGESLELSSNISLAEAYVLYHYIRKLKPVHTAEVGFAQGISTIAILLGLDHNGQGLHEVIDPFQANYQDAGLALVKRIGLEHRLKFHRKFAEEVLPNTDPIQFGFIDSSHLFDLTLAEFVLMDKKLEVGGAIAFHDTWMSSIQKVIRYILSNRSYRLLPELGETPLPAQSLYKKLRNAALSRAANLIPGARRMFRMELLRPWDSFKAGNLVILEKLAPDNRDWRFHNPF